MKRILLLVGMLVLFAKPAYSDFIIEVDAPAALQANSGIHTIDLRIWSDNSDMLAILAADFSIAGPSTAQLTSPAAGQFGVTGMVGFGNINSASFDNNSNVGTLSLELTTAEGVAALGPGTLLARLSVDTSSLVEGVYNVNIADALALNGSFDVVGISGGGSFTVVPEPSSLMLVGLVAGACALHRRGRRSVATAA